MFYKANGFKRKPEEETESPSKKMKLSQTDGNASIEMEMKLSQTDGNGSIEMEMRAPGGEVREGKGGG